MKSFFLHAWLLTAVLSGFSSSLFERVTDHPTQSTKSAPSKGQRVSNPLNDLLDEAQRDIAKNDFEAAIVPLQKFLKEQPDVAYAHFQLAYCYTGLKRTNEAREEYERAISIDPKMAEAYLNLGMLSLDSEPARAVAPLKKAVELLPSQSRPRYLLGLAYQRTGDLKNAAEAFEVASRLDPKDEASLEALGTVQFNGKRFADAENSFRKALGLAPNSPPILLAIARSVAAQNKADAVPAYQNYLAVQPADEAARSEYFHILIQQEQFDTALAELDRAEKGRAPTLDSLKMRADLQIGQKKWDDAVVTLQKAVALAPNDVLLHGGLGRVYLQKRDFALAEQELKIALKIDPNNLTYWKDLSSTYYLSGNWQATLATLDVIAKAETPGAGAWFIRGLCYDKLRMPKPALEAYQKFLELDQGKNPDQVWQATERSKVLRHMLEQKR